MKKIHCLLIIATLLGILGCQTIPDEIRDYVCVINLSYHSNIDRFLKDIIVSAMEEGDKDLDEYAGNLEYIRRGGFGSGFIYVDTKGDNYIITNYHVIEGAERLSITFENETGKKNQFLNLTVLNVDEKADLAILAFPNGERPFKSGMTLSSGTPSRIDAIRAAGYPSLYNKPVWGWTTGNVSNARIELQGHEGRYIQHNAPINPGNSGGPLLVADKKANLGYSVVGINTMIITSLQGTNFAIPIERVLLFLDKTFTNIDESVRLESRVNDFITLINKSQNDLVYEELALLLSNNMLASRPDDEYAASPEEIQEKILDDPITGLGWAVAYNQIENYVFNKDSNNIRAELVSTEPNNFGGYTVRLLIGDYPYKTEWIKSYGTWRIDSFVEDDGEYNDYFELATIHPLGKKVKYTFGSSLDHDWYVIEIPRPGKVTVYTEGDSDTQIELFSDPFHAANLNDSRIAENDDDVELNARVSVNIKAGPLHIRVKYPSVGLGLVGTSGEEYTLIAQLE